MNAISIAVALLLMGGVVLAVRFIRRHPHSCGGDCAHCSGCDDKPKE